MSIREKYTVTRSWLGWRKKKTLSEDLETSDRYIAVPHKNDLGLGRRLALAFVDQELSDEYDTVAGFFGRRGAYGRFKALLHARGMLERWYEFENLATEKALLAWCEENGIQLLMHSHERSLGSRKRSAFGSAGVGPSSAYSKLGLASA